MTLRVAVIGAAATDRNHARFCWDLPEVELVGLADATLCWVKVQRWLHHPVSVDGRHAWPALQRAICHHVKLGRGAAPPHHGAILGFA